MYDPLIAKELFARHGRAIAHMRQRLAVKRLSLVLGAGVSKSLGFPSWSELLDRIADHDSVRARKLTGPKEHATYRSQILFQHYRAQMMRAAPVDAQDSFALRCEIEVGWKKALHECLYREAKHTRIESADHYIAEFLPIIRRSPLTITYNFDDSLERMLLSKGSPDERKISRGYKTVWSPNPQIEGESAVVYHPNGFLPWQLTEQPSEELVFLEETFADQLIASTSGEYSLLLNHLAQSTNLLIGLSLEDPTLRHLLRQTARLYPGHIQYYIKFVQPDERLDPKRLSAEYASNFRVHNLVTLFLNEKQIYALGRLLSELPEQYEARLRDLNLPLAYRFFFAGAVGVGKTTALSHFRNLRALEEWLDFLPPKMAVDPHTLESADLEEIDAWVDDQLERKNNRLITAGCGVDVIDRAPLDAFAFVPTQQWPRRARQIRAALQRTTVGHCNGHLILLKGDPNVIEPRAKRVIRAPSRAGIERQQKALEWIYSSELEGVTIINTEDHTAIEVARLVADVIHNQPYVEFDFDERLAAIERGARASEA